MSALIPLARVQFREAVNLPGESAPGRIAYPRNDDVVLSVELDDTQRVLTRERYRIALDTRYGHVLITHPKSGETEHYPLSLVRQWRPLSPAVAAPKVA